MTRLIGLLDGISYTDLSGRSPKSNATRSCSVVKQFNLDYELKKKHIRTQHIDTHKRSVTGSIITNSSIIINSTWGLVCQNTHQEFEAEALNVMQQQPPAELINSNKYSSIE